MRKGHPIRACRKETREPQRASPKRRENVADASRGDALIKEPTEASDRHGCETGKRPEHLHPVGKKLEREAVTELNKLDALRKALVAAFNTHGSEKKIVQLPKCASFETEVEGGLGKCAQSSVEQCVRKGQ